MDVRPDRADRQATRDIYQVGARNMQNYTLLRELGRTRKPVLLKRGISRDDRGVAVVGGVSRRWNDGVILCERGIPHVRDRDAEHLRHPPRFRRQELVTCRSRIRATALDGADMVAQLARAAVAGRRRRVDHRVHNDPDRAAQRWRPVDVPGTVRSTDGGTAHHRAGDRSEYLSRVGRASRLGARPAMAVGVANLHPNAQLPTTPNASNT